jgi:hypothetical protein
MIDLLFYLTILSVFAVIACPISAFAWIIVCKIERVKLEKKHNEIWIELGKVFERR